MPWNSTSPNGSISVKANRTGMQQNTTYIETTMGNSVVGTNTTSTRDHFWDVGANEDGRHRFIQSPGFTVGGVPTDPVVGTGMDGVLYLKSDERVSARIQGFYRNAQGVYQYLPAFLSGSLVVTNSFSTIVAIPENVYGEIFMFRETINGDLTIQNGIFKSSLTGLGAAANRYTNDTGDEFTSLRFTGSGLNLRVRTDSAPSGNTWQYRITYRAI